MEELIAGYQSQEQLGELVFWFALLAIVIACLGLFELATFMAEQRTKEICARKVLSASTPGLSLPLLLNI